MRFHAGSLGWRTVSALALALCAQIGHTSEMSLYTGSTLVLGDSARVVQLDVPSAGVLSMDWTDLDFASSLASLDVDISNGTKPMGDYQSGGSMTLNLSGPVKLYVTIFASAQGSMDVGLYHVSAMFVPTVAAVPVPGLGISGLGVAVLGVLALAYRGWHRLKGSTGVQVNI